MGRSLALANKVDLNCDMGESFGPWTMGDDKAVFPYITSANVACGFHGGDPRIMAQTVETAKKLGVGVGAHPGFADLVGFGRRNLDVSATEARTDVLYQIGALAGFCRRYGVSLQHVKPHGQLNNLAMHNRTLADAIVAGIRDFDPDLIIVAYGGELVRAANAQNMRVAYEVYADREYNRDGTLVSRKLPDSVITDRYRVVERAIQMVKTGEVMAMDGSLLTLPVHTICVHGDTPGASTLVAELRQALSQSDIEVMPLSRVVP